MKINILALFMMAIGAQSVSAAETCLSLENSLPYRASTYYRIVCEGTSKVIQAKDRVEVAKKLVNLPLVAEFANGAVVINSSDLALTNNTSFCAMTSFTVLQTGYLWKWLGIGTPVYKKHYRVDCGEGTANLTESQVERFFAEYYPNMKTITTIKVTGKVMGDALYFEHLRQGVVEDLEFHILAE